MNYIIDMIGNQKYSEIAEIQDMSYPQTVPANTPFTFSYKSVNLSTQTLSMFGYILIGNEIAPGSEWTQIIQGHSYYPFFMTLSLQESVNGTVVIGHLEEDVCSSFQNQPECEFNNCYWYDNSCHSVPDDDEPQEMNLLIPLAILGLGIATIVIISASKKPTRT